MGSVATAIRSLALLSLVLSAGAAGALAPAAQAEGFGVQEKNFEAGTCTVATCTYASIEKDHAEAFTQAAGHPPDGITGFELNSESGLLGRTPIGSIKRVRVDVPPGLAANPQALPKCSKENFEKDKCPENTEVGINELTIAVAGADVPVTGKVYNLEQPAGLPLLFGIHVELAGVVNEHIFLEGHVSWNTDYHEYFEINNISKTVPILESKLIFFGTAGEGNFLTLPSVCSSSTTSYLEVESYEGEISQTQTHTPVGVEGCEEPPFEPTAEAHPETSQSDEPDGATVEVKVPQHAGAKEINTADIRDAQVTLPEGLTLNPAAAHGLAACSETQAVLNETSPGVRPTGPVTCPAAARIGTATIETDLPPGTLSGDVYLGSPGGGPITSPPYTIYIDAESVYGVSVRLKGQVTPNPLTGRLQGTFSENPELPFSDLILHLDGGKNAPLANPLVCGAADTEALFTPYTGQAAALSSTPFTTTGCPAPLPFALAQSTQSSSAAAGAYTAYTFSLARNTGQQYVAQVKTTLPAGLLGAIPSVPLCGEPQAGAGACPSASEIGTVSVAAGSGPEPYVFNGHVYLTGPYAGAPYGLSIAVPAVAGPFNLGTVLTRAQISVEQNTARVLVTAAVPTIWDGVPLRLRSLSVDVNRPNFLFNPTNCAALASESTLGSTLGASQNIASPFQAGECAKLAFKPALSAASGARPTRLGGARLEVKLAQPAHEANIRQVLMTLPKQLSAQEATLRKACPAATFEAGPAPGGCPESARVGSVSVSTPVLPGKLEGPAYLVSHGGQAFPDLDLIVRGDGVQVVLVGHTFISPTGVTSSKFETLPDVPITSVAVQLPMGPQALLSAHANPCETKLLAPTTIISQSGVKLEQTTTIAVQNCPVEILSHRVHGNRVRLTVLTPAAGRVAVGGRYLQSVTRRIPRAGKRTVSLELTRAGVARLGRQRKFKTRLVVKFKAKSGPARSKASVTVIFRRPRQR